MTNQRNVRTPANTPKPANAEKQDLPLWTGLWVPFAVLVFVLAKVVHLFGVPVAVGIDLVAALIFVGAGRASQKAAAGRQRR